MAKFGFSALNQNLNPNNNNGFNVQTAINQANLISAVSVKSIILDEFHPRFVEAGEWNGLGTIEYEDGSSLTLVTQTDSNGRSNNISYSNPYDGAYCTIYVDENLQQTDSVDVQECYDLFNMEDVEKLHSDIKIISEKYTY
jgi:hypothetical protein